MYDNIITDVKVVETEDGFRIEIKGDKQRLKAMGFAEGMQFPFGRGMGPMGPRGFMRGFMRGWGRGYGRGGRGHRGHGRHHGHHQHGSQGHHGHDGPAWGGYSPDDVVIDV